LAPLDFENFSKKGYFLGFEWAKSSLTTFGPPPRRILEKSFRRPFILTLVIACSRHVYVGVSLHAHPVRGESPSTTC